MSNFWWCGAFVTAMIIQPARSVRAQSADAQKAMMSVVGLDLTSAEIVSWCTSAAPASATQLRAAYQAWRTRSDVEALTQRLNADVLRRTRDGMVSVINTTRQKIAAAGAPATVCPQLTSMWNSAEFDTRRSAAAAYRADGTDAAQVTTRTGGGGTPPAPPSAAVPTSAAAPASAAAPPTTTGQGGAAQPRGQFDRASYSTNSRPSGTVYTVAQLSALTAQWYGTSRNVDRALAALKSAGTMYVRGTVTKYNEYYHVESVGDGFTSRMTIAPTIDISAFLGQEITLELELTEVPYNMVFPGKTRVVRDPSGLRASTLPSEPGMRRTEVAAARVTAAAGRGLRAQDIHGMLYTAYGAQGASGYEFREEMRLLLNDGWAYLGHTIAPLDLDVAASRRLEPQHWARWRASGRDFELQENDDQGRPEGTWKRKSGRLLPTWPANHRLTGTYSAASFYGSVALGGTYSKTSFAFRSDGRWERIGFSRSSSAAIAAQEPVGYNGGGASVSDGSGTKSSAGGGNAGVYAGSSSSRDDGAKNRGTYRLDGMTIELKADDGTVVRILCLPTDNTYDSIYIYGQSYSRK